jgi:hypothetical protein
MSTDEKEQHRSTKAAAKVLPLAVVGLVAPGASRRSDPESETSGKATNLLFIRDGPGHLTLHRLRWAQDGPNIRRMMDEGASGYSIPDFPSHTPTNFASLLTGAHPNVHGVADGPMHIEGAPLVRPSVAGFASNAKKVAPIWKVLEQAGKKVALLAIPGSTPPSSTTASHPRPPAAGRGYSPSTLSPGKLAERKEAGKAFRLFFSVRS